MSSAGERNFLARANRPGLEIGSNMPPALSGSSARIGPPVAGLYYPKSLQNKKADSTSMKNGVWNKA
jgi:hypothetical protein